MPSRPRTLALACALGLTVGAIALSSPASAGPIAPAAKSASGKLCTITGTAKAETLTGSSKADVICGLGGNDIINGNGGNDEIDGGPGDDTINGGAGSDVLIGGVGKDKLVGGPDVDTASFPTGSAGVTASLAAGTAVSADSGSDTLSTVENLLGGSGPDTLAGDGAVNRLEGGPGADTLAGGGANDTMVGQAGVDTVTYAGDTAGVKADLEEGRTTGTQSGRDALTSVENLIGGTGPDSLTGNSAANRLEGGQGADFIDAKGGIDTILGGPGDDGIIGGNGADVIDGGAGENTCEEDADDDRTSCVYDENGPVIVTLAVSATGTPPTVDTSAQKRTVTVTMRITDNLMGTDYVNVVLTSPTGVVGYAEAQASRSTGTIRDGSYSATLELPRQSPEGDYRIAVYTTDTVGNLGELSADSGTVFTRQGVTVGPSVIRQSGEGDGSAPVVSEVTVSSTSIDTSTGDVEVTITATVSDAGTGVDAVTISVSGPTCTPCFTSQNAATRTSGSAADGVYTRVITFPGYIAPATYRLYIRADDGVRNATILTTSGQATQFLDGETVIGPSVIVQTGAGDAEAPTVSSVSPSPASIDTAEAAATVTVTVEASDDLSGVKEIWISATRAGAANSYSVKATRTAGTDTDGTWSGDIVFPQGAAAGTYSISLSLTDRALNSQTVTGQGTITNG